MEKWRDLFTAYSTTSSLGMVSFASAVEPPVSDETVSVALPEDKEAAHN